MSYATFVQWHLGTDPKQPVPLHVAMHPPQGLPDCDGSGAITIICLSLMFVYCCIYLFTVLRVLLYLSLHLSQATAVSISSPFSG
jgi:hypothetical protein